jgi:hypothetical protein
MQQKYQKQFLYRVISATLRRGTLPAVVAGLALVSPVAMAGNCTADSGGAIICDGTTSVSGQYSIIAGDGSDGVVLNVHDATLRGKGSLVDGSGYVYGGGGNNVTLNMTNSTAAEIVGSGDGTVINLYSGHYGRVMGGAGSNIINMYGNATTVDALSGDFLNDPGGSSDTDTSHDVLNMHDVTDAVPVNPLGLVTIEDDQSTGFAGQAAGYGFEEINLLGASNLTLNNDLWQAAKANSPVLSISQTATLHVNGQRVINGEMNNSGVLVLDNGTSGNTLHITGNYTGVSGSQLLLGTRLAGDSSATDKLTVDGNTSGTTAVTVTNAGGSGAKTLNGIEVVHVGGSSSAEFSQNGRITAGAFDYTLARGAGANSGNWYLSSTDTTPVTPVDPVNPDPTPSADNNVRPEAAAYGVNAAAGNTLFTT